MANLLEKASIILTPTAYDDGKVLAIKPSEAPYGDFDFTRNSSATRVNAQGLVEDVQILSSNLVQNGDFSQIGSEEVTNGNFSQEGSELVTNGDFATDSDWAKNPNWTISGGTANCDGTSDGSFFQGSVIQDSKQYLVTYTISNLTQGGLRVQLSGTQGVLRTLNGTYTEYITSGLNPSGRVSFDCSSSPIGSIDNVSVKEVGQDWTLGTGWSIGEDKAIAVSGASTRLEQSISGLSGKTCKVSFTLSDYGGSGSVYVDFGSVNSDLINTNGIHIVYGTFDQDEFELFKGAAFNGSITNISVKEVGQNWSITNQSGATSNIILGALNIVTDGAFTNAEQTSVLTSGNNYRLTYTIISNAVVGNLQATIGNASVSILVPSIVGTHTVEFTSAGNAAFAFKRGGGSLNTSISNISVIEITDDTNLPRINYSGFTYQDSLGSEEVVNGGFDNGTNAWGITNASYEVLNGELKIYNQTSNPCNSFQTVSGLIVGKQYKVSATSRLGGSGGNVARASFFGNTFASSSGQSVTETIIITASSTTATISLFVYGTSLTEGYFDNVSVKEYSGQEVVPDSGCGAWLFEPQSTNLITQSEDFSGYTLRNGASITSNYSTSPDGNENATRLLLSAQTLSRIEDIANGSSVLNKNHTVSCYVKSNGANTEFRLKCTHSGVLDYYSPNLIATSQWQRFTFTQLFGGSGGDVFTVGVLNSTLNNAADLSIYGLQLEEDKSYATSYIPTEGTIKTRNQDLCTNGGDVSLINSSEGVLYAQIAALANDGTNRRISLSDGTNVKRLLIFFDATNSISALVRISGVTSFGFTFASDITQLSKIALKWKQDDFALWVDGLEVGASTSGNTFAADALNTFTFTDGSVGSLPFFGNTKALGVWKEALTDAELRSLTYPTPTAPTFDLDFNTIATDFTFTRNSEATFVNAQGLIQSTNEIGAELITNGDFSSDTAWTKIGNAIIQNGYAELTFDGTTGNQVRQTTLTSGKTYKVQYEITSNTSTNGQVFMNAFSNGSAINISVGVYTLYLTAINTTFFNFRTLGGSGGSVHIDNVSVKEYITETNTPRLDYSTGAEAFLLEPQSTNLVTNSNDFSVSSWIETGITSTLSATELSPNGFDYSTSLVGDVATSSTKRTRNSHSATLLTAHSFSVYVKADSRNYIQLVNSGDAQGYANFDIANGIVGTLGSKSTSKITSLSNGWFRCELTTDATTVNGQFMIYLADNNISNFASASSGTEGVYVWGAQLEELSYATSLIPTSGTTVTRNQELCVDATPVINSEEGVLYAEIAKQILLNDVIKLISLNSGSSDADSVTIGFHNSTKIYARVRANGVNQFLNTTFATNENQFYKVALRYKSGNISLWIDGVEIATSTSTFSFNLPLSDLSFDYNGNNTLPFFGNTKGLKYYPKALSDVELQDLTTI